jgi:tRNA threonylcarbamoyladenosine biosynthesis protein TsaB
MIVLLLDTSTSECRLTLVRDNEELHEVWQANRELANGLLKHIDEFLQSHNILWQQLTALAAYKGPGSFTGLRIGLTVLNTAADSLGIPIVGETGEQWRVAAIERLKNGENDQIVLPLYGGEANITKPRK